MVGWCWVLDDATGLWGSSPSKVTRISSGHTVFSAPTHAVVQVCPVASQLCGKLAHVNLQPAIHQIHTHIERGTDTLRNELNTRVSWWVTTRKIQLVRLMLYDHTTCPFLCNEGRERGKEIRQSILQNKGHPTMAIPAGILHESLSLSLSPCFLPSPHPLAVPKLKSLCKSFCVYPNRVGLVTSLISQTVTGEEWGKWSNGPHRITCNIPSHIEREKDAHTDRQAYNSQQKKEKTHKHSCSLCDLAWGMSRAICSSRVIFYNCICNAPVIEEEREKERGRESKGI